MAAYPACARKNEFSFLLSDTSLSRRESTLFPSCETRLRIENMLTESLIEIHRKLPSLPVSPPAAYDGGRKALSLFDFSTSKPLEEVLLWTIAQMESGVVHVNHPRYFGLFNPAPSFAAQCGERITATFNAQLATRTTSPFPVEMEAHLIRAVGRRIGFPHRVGGHFASGGSEANHTSLICALTRANAGFGLHGVRSFSGPPCFYVSSEAHLAWLKIAHEVGIGRTALRLIATDGFGRIDCNELAAAIHKDLQEGSVPIMIAATAGTTAAGMIDPLPECAAIACEHGLWFHVDAAWGGAAIASDRLRGLLAGVELADSVTIDAHKWFATTMGCAMFLTSLPDALAAAFQVNMECMPSNDQVQDPYVTTMQWSRRFLGLRFFLALASVGWAGYGKHVDRSMELAALLSAGLVERGWRRVNEGSLAVVCAAPPKGQTADSVVRSINLSGTAWVSTVNFEGRSVLRACITSGETSADDIEMLLTKLDDVRQ